MSSAPRKKKKHDDRAVCIQGELTIFRAAELAALLDTSPPPPELDLSGVTEIDSAGLQLLMRARLRALEQHSELRLVACSAAVIEVFELLGLKSFFGDPIIVAPPQAMPATQPTPAQPA